MTTKRIKRYPVLNFPAGIIWVLIANRSGAELFESSSRLAPWHLLQSFDHSEGHLKNGEIDSDRPGRTKDRFGTGRHAMSKEYSPKQIISQHFAHLLAGVLDKAEATRKFDHLILVAPSPFLGELRSILTKQTNALVAGEIAKDLIPCDQNELREHLEVIVREVF